MVFAVSCDPHVSTTFACGLAGKRQDGLNPVVSLESTVSQKSMEAEANADLPANPVQEQTDD